MNREDTAKSTKQRLESRHQKKWYSPSAMCLLILLLFCVSAAQSNHTETADRVHQLLLEAEGLFRSARYDLAAHRYQQILNIDKYNIAARRGMTAVNKAREKSQENAYQQIRSEMLTEVEAKWELPIRRSDLGVSTIIEQPQIDLTSRTPINQKLDGIFIPRIELHETTIREAFEYLKQCAATLDHTESDPTRKGINIVLKLTPELASTASTISLQLSNIPLRAALDYLAAAAGLKVKVEPYAVAIIPISEPDEVLLTKEYKVPPSFINSLPSFDSTASSSDHALLPTRSGAKEFLEAQGVTFPPGSGAQFIPANSKLIVKNTPSNLELIDSLVEISLATPPAQIEIQAKFLEVTQNNLRELGLDWLLGEFTMPFGSGISGSGGTRGNQSSSPTVHPFLNPTTGIPIGENVNRTGQLTAGNRSGSAAIRVNTLDGLLLGMPLSSAPGILSIAGVFTDPQFQLILRALDQAKGVDLLSSPTITTKSGQRAKIELVREFIYPTEYDPPQVPKNQSSIGVNPAIPATPSRWAMEPVGVELEVEPTIGPDGYTVDLNLRPKVVEFEGFINYGSPIETIAPVLLTEPVTGAVRLSGSHSVTLTSNTINQPVFSIREVTTNVTIHDGQTLMLGGLMREDTQKIEDKTPIVGDIPLLGRLFRSNAIQRVKRNLIIFVTAKLVDPSGQPINKTTETPFSNEEDVLPIEESSE